MDLLRDYLSSRVIASGKRLEDYTKIYFQTNEDLVTAYRDIDFFDKDVLSVLASSDQVFTARYQGARKVDSFDKNVLSLYYYYLRVWTIRYMDEVYPTKVLSHDYDWLSALLSKVDPHSEEEKMALMFWEMHLKEKTELSQLFFEDNREGKVVFRTTHSIGSVVDQNMKFQTINLFEENDFSDTYDIVLLSNIIEWARGKEDKIICIRDNLSRALNQNGLVLCSGLINRDLKAVQEERRIFDSSFDFQDLGRTVGYVYQKR